jgi:lycopene cyclase domain-containing protein
MLIRYTYLLVDFFCMLFPVLFSFHPKIKFHTQIRYFILPCLLTATFFILWDMLYTYWGVWSFNPSYLTGLYFFNLPIEEILFFVCIPYACVFTYHTLKRLLHVQKYNKYALIFSWALIAFLVLTAVLHLSELYTEVTFILLATFLAWLAVKRVSFLMNFYLAFACILLPFFISNGILTGSFLIEPVVIYNPAENLGIRIGTIPVEDIFYGMLLVLMNITLFEYFARKKSRVK